MTEPQQATAQIAIQSIYLKDASFESPAAPEIFAAGNNWKPEIKINFQVEKKTLGEGVYHILLTVTVNAKQEEKDAFLAEVQQAGIFHIKGFPEQQLTQILQTYCPGQLLPYARQTISDLVSKGNFPQLLLPPINFDRALNQQQAGEQQAGEQPPTTH